jgi:16S rRNA (cytosine967-C5)-methyltransferase
MKLYKNLVNSLAFTLQEIFVNKKYADKALERLFKQNPQWGSRDRRFVAEGVYDIVRHFRLYSTLAETENNFWFITAVWLVVKKIDLPDWPEFRHVNAAYILKRQEELKQNLPVTESYPDWLWELCGAELGKDAWMAEAHAMNSMAPVFLRANLLKTSAEGLKQQLEKDGIQSREVAGVPNALELVKRENIFSHRLFKEGWFEVQDAGLN